MHALCLYIGKECTAEYMFISEEYITIFWPGRFTFEGFNSWYHIDEEVLYIYWNEGINKLKNKQTNNNTRLYDLKFSENNTE